MCVHVSVFLCVGWWVSSYICVYLFVRLIYLFVYLFCVCSPFASAVSTQWSFFCRSRLSSVLPLARCRPRMLSPSSADILEYAHQRHLQHREHCWVSEPTAKPRRRYETLPKRCARKWIRSWARPLSRPTAPRTRSSGVWMQCDDSSLFLGLPFLRTHIHPRISFYLELHTMGTCAPRPTKMSSHRLCPTHLFTTRLLDFLVPPHFLQRVGGGVAAARVGVRR